ncbi:uncharacterized protein LOC116344914 [Contarinia nasturtii]|uniref:uncharacterized protein LOC116344914 n=1 Tax=Contarinia nasturtii TaxID=265458 RepID=UPI0012D483A5|nr:uncharacterized protein LOC116344914 [Contarinia nasturtii]
MNEENEGGVLIALKSELDGEEFKTQEMSNLEAPRSPLEIYENHLKAINSIEKVRSVKDIVLYCGDWNLPEIKWHINDDGLSFLPILGESESQRAVIARIISNKLLEMGLSQLCDFENVSGNVLDLFYTNMPELACMERADIKLIPDLMSDKAHVQTMCVLECQPKVYVPECTDASRFCFNKANYEEIRESLSYIDFDHLINFEDINMMMEAFYEIIYKICDQHVPKSSLKISNKPIWFNKRLINLKNIRNREYKKLVRRRYRNDNADVSEFVKAKTNFDDYHSECYNNYIKEIAVNSKHNPKKFWQHVNGRRKSSGVPCKVELDGESAQCDNDKANLFAKFFSSVYVEYDEDQELGEFIKNRSDHGCFKISITTEAVMRVLETLDLNKKSSPDNIAPIFF